MSELPLATLASLPVPVIRLVFSALKFKRKGIKSARKIRKGMIKGGMSREMADELSRKYEEIFSIRRLMAGATGGEGLSSLIEHVPPVYRNLKICG
jgi:hypothetical protein